MFTSLTNRLTSRLLLSVALLLPGFFLLPGCGHASGGQDGLYLRTSYAFGHLDTSTVYLEGDRIAWNPKGGINPFDFAAAEKSDPQNVGHFKINGDQMEVTWGGGRAAQSLRIERQNGKMSALDGGLISKAEGYPADKRLDASYGGVMSAGAVSAGRTLNLSKDGHCNMSTLGTVELSSDVPGGTGSASSQTSGTYKLGGNTLTLNFADGKTERHTVIPYSTAIDPAKAELSDGKLFFDQFMLRRER